MSGTCCGTLEKLRDDYDLPFAKPIVVTDNGQLGIGGWAVKLMTLTKSGHISHRRDKHRLVYLNYCPFCGQKLPSGDEGAR